MAVALRAAGAVTRENANTNLVLAKPAGTVDDDFLIAVMMVDTSSWVITPPAGWTALSTQLLSTADGGILAAYYKKAASEPSTWTWSHTANANRNLGAVLAYSGVDTTTPLDVTPSGVSNNSLNASPVSVSATGITVANAGMLVWIAGGDAGSAGAWAWTDPSGFSNQFTDSQTGSPSDGFMPLCVSGKSVSAGATGTITGTLTLGGGSSGWMTFLAALRASAGGGGPVLAGALLAPRQNVLTRL